MARRLGPAAASSVTACMATLRSGSAMPHILGSGKQFSPFAVALSAHSLIRDWEETRDPRCLSTLRQAADWLWLNAWDPKVGEWPMTSMGSTVRRKGQSISILLIAPMYAFLYAETGDPKYRDRADALFSAGVHNAYLAGGKQFNQNYWWSFDFVRWRTQGQR